MQIYLDNQRAEYLKTDLCVQLGFCSMRERYDTLIQSLPAEIDTVVDAIFVAEGLNPVNADRQLWQQVKNPVLKVSRSR